MAFVIKYHKLFEVRLIHGFELKDADAFLASTEAAKATELISTHYDISKYLTIKPTPACRKRLDGHRLKFVTCPTGFFVGVATEPSILGGDLVKPQIPIADQTVFDFKVKIADSNWSNVTNLALQPALDARFYFSNYQDLPELTYPNLALPPSLLNPERSYEMGEIIESGGTVFQAKSQVDGTVSTGNANFWETPATSSWTTNRDKMLLPLRFNYRYPTNAGVSIQNAVFTLKKLDGTDVKIISINEPTSVQQSALDFRKLSSTDPDVESGRYFLEVNSPGNYAATHLIHLDETLFNRQELGTISIAHQAGLNDFRLLENNGDLRTEANMPRPPVFEIHFKNRRTYWQFIQHPADSYVPPAAHPDFEFVDNKVVTRNPRPLTKFFVDLTLPGTGKKVSNPTNLLLKTDATKEKYISEIYLPRLNI